MRADLSTFQSLESFIELELVNFATVQSTFVFSTCVIAEISLS